MNTNILTQHPHGEGGFPLQVIADDRLRHNPDVIFAGEFEFVGGLHDGRALVSSGVQEKNPRLRIFDLEQILFGALDQNFVNDCESVGRKEERAVL